MIFLTLLQLEKISIHALREEGDARLMGMGILANTFLSTPSARRATLSQAAPLSARGYFYPRPPRGGRLLRIV